MTRALAALIAAACAHAADAAPADAAFFRERIRPILAQECWRCHGPTKQRNGLRLDSRAAALRGGHTIDIVPGDPQRSRLLDAVGYEDEDLQMPPDARLGDAQIADLAEWIRRGAPWDDGPPAAAGAPSAGTAVAAPAAERTPPPGPPREAAADRAGAAGR